MHNYFYIDLQVNVKQDIKNRSNIGQPTYHLEFVIKVTQTPYGIIIPYFMINIFHSIKDNFHIVEIMLPISLADLCALKKCMRRTNDNMNKFMMETLMA